MKFNGINVYSEIGELKRVLIHRPGKEIARISPRRLDELLFSAILEPETAVKEHDAFVEILKKEGVEVVELVNLVADTYKAASKEVKEKFVQQWLDESIPKLTKPHKELVKKHLEKMKPEELVKTMIEGIFADELGIKSKTELLIDPMPNLYFTRDNFASVGNGITINKMAHPTRQRETLFAEFIFAHNSEFKQTPEYYSREFKNSIEGGDIFIYTKETLVVGVSERTKLEAIIELAKNIKKVHSSLFKKIIAINVPKMPNLMHLDTWLTMLDHDKFLYSPNMLTLTEWKTWTIDLTAKEIKAVESNAKKLEEVIEKIIGKKPILIPVAGENAHQLDIDVETHFDATNYLVIRPGVIVGYNRNIKTAKALEKAGVKVLSFKGNQLSLGMGSARCMSMPLFREDIK